jgi:uncharacterized membrane protein YqaE (UPF0057 family)
LKGAIQQRITTMLYPVAVLLPPLALLLAGRPIQAIMCLFLQASLIGWFPAAIWALIVVQQHYADRRGGRLLRTR